MMKATLVGLVMMALGSGCARDAVVAASPAAAPVRECPEYLSPGAMADCRAGYVECGDGPQTGVCAPANEEYCMGVAERAYELAAGKPMTGLGDAPMPDAAYEDAYAACTGADVETREGSQRILGAYCSDPVRAQGDHVCEQMARDAAGLTGEAKAERDLEAVR